MPDAPPVRPSRRGFLAGLGLLVIASRVSLPARAASDYPLPNERATLDVFVGIDGDGTVNVLCPSSEMGQGVSTGLAQIVAEELDAPWESVRVLHADESRAYRFVLFPLDPRQLTGGSLSVRTWYQPLREAGAKARGMLLAAAAARWDLDARSLSTDAGVVRAPDGRSATYGELAAEAARQRPRKAPLKDPATFSLIGTSPPREDLRGKVTGTTEYGVDVRLPGMLRACSVACPVFGGRVRSADDTAARAIPGVVDVLVFDDFVAVVAQTWWPAKKAVEALRIEWDPGEHAGVSSADITADLRARLEDGKGALAARKRGKAKKILAAEGATLEAVYEVPYLDHAPMEPLNCTVHLQKDRCDVWTGTQGPTSVLRAAKRITGLPARKIHVHTTYLGGGFGRRGNYDWTERALAIATRVDAPVQLLWTREETTRQGIYRPVEAARFRAKLTDGELEALHVRIAGDHSGRALVAKGFHGLAPYKKMLVEGMREHESPYRYPNVLVEAINRNFHVPVGYWRSVGQSYTAFFRESFLDEVAHALGKDPVELRRSLIPRENTRWHAVLDRVVAEAGWGEAPEGHFQGIGLADWFGTLCAEIVELTLVDGRPRIQKITAAVDCGRVIHPDQVRAQIMGGAIYGLSSALGEAVTIEAGRVVQSNFHDYPLLRMPDAPYAVDVHLVERPEAPPTGIGEPGTPPAIPAFCNALFAATGTRVRTLPLTVGWKEAET